MILLNAIICFFIAVRLFLFQRENNKYKLLFAVLAWGLICSSSSVALFTLFNQFEQVQVAQTIMNSLVFTCLLRTKGNVTYFIQNLFSKTKNLKPEGKIR